MKKVILTPAQDTIEVAQLTGREIVCYLSHKTNTPKLLVKLSPGRHHHSLTESWGVISLAYPNGDIVFYGDTFKEAVRKVLQAGSTVFTFSHYMEYREWLSEQPVK